MVKMESSIVWIVIILQNFFIASRFILSQNILILVVLIVNFVAKLSQQEMRWRCTKKETIPNKWIKLTNTFAYRNNSRDWFSYIKIWWWKLQGISVQFLQLSKQR